jgi:hypothetical protein
MNFDDTQAYIKFPDDAWVYNKLELYRKLGYYAAPHGVIPDRYPVISKPIVNLWGLALGVDRWCSPADVTYKAGYLWMEEFTGTWMSYDIDYESGIVWKAQALCDCVWQGTPSGWQVEKSHVTELPQQLVNEIQQLGLKSKQINVETIGGNITEIHLRWSFEISQWYDQAQFEVEVIWSQDPNTSAPDGWIPLWEENRSIQISQGKPFRVAHRRK